MQIQFRAGILKSWNFKDASRRTRGGGVRGAGGTQGRADGLMNISWILQPTLRKGVLIKGKKPQLAELFAFHYW